MNEVKPSTAEWINQKKESLKCNAETLKLSSHRRTKSDKEKPVCFLGYHKKKMCELLESHKEKKEKKSKSLLKEIIAQNFPNLWRDLAIQVYEAHSSPNSTQRDHLQVVL